MSRKTDPMPLLHTVSGRERIVVALNWDAREGKTTILDRLKGTHHQYDLDLSCFIFDRDGVYTDFVGAMAQDSMDATGCIYHSGDDATGEGDNDDETISCELAGLPATASQLVFVAEIRSNQVFADIGAPRFHIADGASNKIIHESPLDAHDGMDKKACVMVRIFRDRLSPSRWSLQVIDDYPDINQVSSWGDYLPRYL